MIVYLEGTIFKKEEDQIILLVNNVGYEILIPAFVMATLHAINKGDHLSLFIYYHQTERQPKPVLIGFNQEIEKEFFLHFISVDAIGPLKATKALEIPVHEIAKAIEEGNSKKIIQLKGIGARTAQKIIATLEGKVHKFISPDETIKTTVTSHDFSEQVFEVLIGQLGHKPSDAKLLISEAMERNNIISTPEELFDEIYRGETN